MSGSLHQNGLRVRSNLPKLLSPKGTIITASVELKKGKAEVQD